MATLPFGVDNYLQQSKEGQSTITKAQNFVGITAAPKTLEQKKAERLAGELVQQRIPQGGRTQEQADRSDLERQISRDLKLQKDVRPEVRQALADGTLSPKELAQTVRDSRLTPLERSVKHLDAADTLKVYEVARPAEKQLLRPHLIRKLYSVKKTMPEIYFAPFAAKVKRRSRRNPLDQAFTDHTLSAFRTVEETRREQDGRRYNDTSDDPRARPGPWRDCGISPRVIAPIFH